MPASAPSPLDPARLRYADVPTPIGVIRVAYDGQAVAYVDLRERGIRRLGEEAPGRVERPPFARRSPPEQLQEYFEGKRRDFEVELAFVEGTSFDHKVWYGLEKIPYGAVRTYGELARSLGSPKGARAVGGAAGRNPVPIIVPCHRLVGQDRSLTGFGMGLWRKRWLLKHEGSYPLPATGRRRATRGRQITLEESLRPPRRSSRRTSS